VEQGGDSLGGRAVFKYLCRGPPSSYSYVNADEAGLPTYPGLV